IQCCFFFFQAEDGIRDDLVTGVQTCALPISTRLERCAISERSKSKRFIFPATSEILLSITCETQPGTRRWIGGKRRIIPDQITRSEERRVGKADRYRFQQSLCRNIKQTRQLE